MSVAPVQFQAVLQQHRELLQSRDHSNEEASDRTASSRSDTMGLVES